MYAVCLSDAMNLTDTVIGKFESRKDADKYAEKWRAHYGAHAGVKILDDIQVAESMRKNRFRDYGEYNL